MSAFTWNAIPSKYKYMAINHNRMVHVFEKAPEIREGRWLDEGRWVGEDSLYIGRTGMVNKDSYRGYERWKSSLRKRKKDE